MTGPALTRVLWVATLASCGAASTDSLRIGPGDASDVLRTDAGAIDGGDPEPVIACGGLACSSGEVCAVFAGASRCYSLGDEPSFANGAPQPWPAALLYCDGDDDCRDRSRCVIFVGEIPSARCVAEAEVGCAFHVGHLCETDLDCHSCPNPGDPDRGASCRNVGVEGLDHLKSCGWN